MDKLRDAMLLLKVTEGPQDEEEILKREVNEESIPKKVSTKGGEQEGRAHHGSSS